MTTRRYQVRRTGWRWGVYAGTGTHALLTFWRWRTAERVAWDLQTAFRDGEYVARCAAPWQDDKSVETCRPKFGNQDSFAGFPPVPVLPANESICYSPCAKHQGMSFVMMAGPAPCMRTVCPICQPPAYKP